MLGGMMGSDRMRKTAIGVAAGALAVLFLSVAGALAAYTAKLKPGDTPPASLGADFDGDEVDAGRYAGKVLVVTFWASWCAPCKQELPLLEAIQRAAGKDKVQVVAINIEDHDTYRRLARGLKSTFTLGINHDARRKASEAYGVSGIPHLVLIGRDGRVISVHRGYSEEAIDSIIAEINRALAGAGT
jgi:thiol-disulfide isomerase/thioredoxin